MPDRPKAGSFATLLDTSYESLSLRRLAMLIEPIGAPCHQYWRTTDVLRFWMRFMVGKGRYTKIESLNPNDLAMHQEDIPDPKTELGAVGSVVKQKTHGSFGDVHLSHHVTICHTKLLRAW